MPFCMSHFSLILFNRAVLEENRSIKTDSETFLCHFIGKVNCLAWSKPVPPEGSINKQGYNSIFKHLSPSFGRPTLNHLSKEILTNTRCYEIFSSAGLTEEKACPVKCLPNEVLSLFHRGLCVSVPACAVEFP